MAFETYAKSFALGTSSTELVTGLGAKETLQITSAVVVNTSAAGRVVNLNLASDGGAAADANAIEDGKSVSTGSAAGTALTGMNVIPGAKLYGYADAVGCTLQLAGLVTGQNSRTW